MPTLPPVPGVARTELVYSWDGQIVENVWFNGGADDDVVNLQTIAAAMTSGWMTYIMPIVSEQVQLLFTRSTYLGVINGNSVEWPAPSNSNGEETSPCLPNNVSVAVKLTTGYGGRARRGRKFHIGLCENQVAFSHLDPTFRANLFDRYTNWITAELGGANPLVIVSYYLNKLKRINPLVTVVTGCTVDPVIDSQRRRLPGRGK